MPEILVLVAGLLVAGIAVLGPLRSPAAAALPDDEGAAAELRHRAALEALRDLEADRRSGTLDEAGYRAQLADAEAEALTTRQAIDASSTDPGPPTRGHGRGGALAAAGAIGAILVGGALVPATGIANETVVNEPLAAIQRAEEDRQALIADLRAELAANPEDPETVSELADAHLAGSGTDDLFRAAAALQLLIALEPDRADAYERILTAYLRAGDHANARAALQSYAERPTADAAEVSFFDGLISLRGENDAAAARRAFDRFLELAPDDPRAPMIRGLRDEAAEAEGR